MMTSSPAWALLCRASPVICVYWWCLTWGAGLCLTAGCSNGWIEEEDQLSHVIPPHKPSSFRSAVGELSRRWSELVDASSAAEAADWSELRDIILWLPENAGDSDLRRAQWEQVQGYVPELEQLYGQLVTGTSVAEADARWREIMQVLETLIPDSEKLLPFRPEEEPDESHEPGKPAGTTVPTETPADEAAASGRPMCRSGSWSAGAHSHG